MATMLIFGPLDQAAAADSRFTPALCVENSAQIKLANTDTALTTFNGYMQPGAPPTDFERIDTPAAGQFLVDTNQNLFITFNSNGLLVATGSTEPSPALQSDSAGLWFQNTTAADQCARLYDDTLFYSAPAGTSNAACARFTTTPADWPSTSSFLTTVLQSSGQCGYQVTETIPNFEALMNSYRVRRGDYDTGFIAAYCGNSARWSAGQSVYNLDCFNLMDSDRTAAGALQEPYITALKPNCVLNNSENLDGAGGFCRSFYLGGTGGFPRWDAPSSQVKSPDTPVTIPPTTRAPTWQTWTAMALLLVQSLIFLYFAWILFGKEWTLVTYIFLHPTQTRLIYLFMSLLFLALGIVAITVNQTNVSIGLLVFAATSLVVIVLLLLVLPRWNVRKRVFLKDIMAEYAQEKDKAEPAEHFAVE